MKRGYQYMFRFCCDPGFREQEELRSFDRFVGEALIDDVLVFANAQDINTGHMNEKELDEYIRLMKAVCSLLRPKGVTLSVNQWHSVMHADYGKKMNHEQRFRRMVDKNGRESDMCVCPLCREWQKYIGGLYARYAALDTRFLWIEDDFRLHNHSPLEWGGCFCEEHMRLYSEAAGRKLTREEFVRGVLSPGEVHPYRKIWLDVSRETMLSAARAIRGAINAVNKSARIGLMSSVPYVHAAEGRDWSLLLKALSGDTVPADRIHLPAYQERVPSQYMSAFNMVSMQCAAMLPEKCEIYPELENYPYGLLSKSRRFTRFQLLSSLPLDPDGMTLDLFDLNGNGIVHEEGWASMLAETKPFLDRMLATGVFSSQRQGVQILCSPVSSATLHTAAGERMEELYPHEVFFAGLLPAYGIPFFYDGSVSVSGRVIAISGQVLRNYTDAEITHLFENNVIILNGDAAATLCDLGLGTLAGIRSVKWLQREDGNRSYEQVSGDRVCVSRKSARATVDNTYSDALEITYLPDARITEYSAFFSYYRKRTGSAEVCCGGRVILFPYGHFQSPAAIPAMLLNSVRAEIMRSAIWECGSRLPIVLGGAYLEPYCYIKGSAVYLYLVNAGLDDLEEIELKWYPDIRSVSAFSSVGKRWRKVCVKTEGERITVSVPVRSLETVLLRFDNMASRRFTDRHEG